MPASRSYVPRSSIPNFGGLIAVALVIFGVAPLAAAYAFVTFHVPFVNMLTLLAAPALGGAAAMIAERAIVAARIRSIPFSLGVMTFAGVFAWYVDWVVWIAVVGNDPALLRLALDPIALARCVVHINQAGSWEFLGYEPTGSVLWLVWAIEAGLIVGTAIYAGRIISRNLYMRPFCEQCRSWLGPTLTIAQLELGDDQPDQLRAWIEDGEWEHLKSRARAEDEDNALQLVVGSCTCGQLNVLAVERHTASDGGFDREAIGRDLLIEDSLVRELGRA